jgi:hypothetical protein
LPAAALTARGHLEDNRDTKPGSMAFLGTPIAHEDSAQRACWVALHLRDQIGRHATEVNVHGRGGVEGVPP